VRLSTPVGPRVNPSNFSWQGLCSRGSQRQTTEYQKFGRNITNRNENDVFSPLEPTQLVWLFFGILEALIALRNGLEADRGQDKLVEQRDRVSAVLDAGKTAVKDA